MREFGFFGTSADALLLTRDLLAQGDITIYFNCGYPTRKATPIKEIDDHARSMIQNNMGYFIWIDGVSVEPPVLRRHAGATDTPQYVIDLKLGGPGLVLSQPAICVEADVPFLSWGHLATSHMYWDKRNHQWLKPGPAILQAFNRVRKIIVGRCEQRIVLGKRVWIGRDACAVIQRQTINLQWYGEYINARAAMEQAGKKKGGR